ncbi:Six-hairpin glycosidase-like protein [Pyrenochaeta sp. MPI-SDFR-AT-0127]|nr:Six-hairpin glycosidase-like protein [Pyrenochaeta sp. MPI-SDFR-AT-0127]
MSSSTIVEPTSISRSIGCTTTIGPSSFTLQNHGDQSQVAEIVLDYGECEGGIPIFEIAQSSGNITMELAIVYSEGIEGIEHKTGDGPFFLFSNAMDTYRSTTLSVVPNSSSQTLRARYAQRSQRYQKITLVSPNSSITFSKVGFERVRPKAIAKSFFSCSNENLNRIWQAGVKTVDMCTVTRGETAPAWEVTESGTKVYGQHWAPCRRGTRWGDKTVRFQVQIESGGASWGIHMVANGLIFCLDAVKRVLYACEGLSHESTIFPVASKGRWSLEYVPLDGWLEIETVTLGNTVKVAIQGNELAVIRDLDIHPLLGGSSNNTGSVAFGGPCHWIAQYRHLTVHGPDGIVLYDNDLLLHNRERTLVDFQVGTNTLDCTIDGAKRDRACFGGDLHVMARSIAHSTMNFKAIAGSIQLLTSHQTSDGFLGNLCPIQAPVHDGNEEPPTYAFYSLTYALLLVVAIKDYWMHTGDEQTRLQCAGPLEKLMSFTQRLINEEGVLSAPPPLSMHWFPMGGPIFGPSGPLNIAYYDSLQAMATMSPTTVSKENYLLKAKELKHCILAHFWDRPSSNFCLSKSLPPGGVCQDVNAYALTTGLTLSCTDDTHHLVDSNDSLPLAFRGLGHWDKANVVSPYASGFAVEAYFSQGQGTAALNLLDRVWGPMVDPSNANFSGGHWEAMKPDGTPLGHDTSLMHGWSTWPVFLMPRYLAGLHPIEAGWKVFGIAPVLAGLENIECTLETVAGTIKVELAFSETAGHGTIRLLAPRGTRAQLEPPKGWIMQGSHLIEATGDWIHIALAQEADLDDLAKGLGPMLTPAMSEQDMAAKPSVTEQELNNRTGLSALLRRWKRFILCN